MFKFTEIFHSFSSNANPLEMRGDMFPIFDSVSEFTIDFENL